MSRRDPFSLLKQFDRVHGVTRRVPLLTWPVRFATWLVYRFLEIALGSSHPHTRAVRRAGALMVEPKAADEPCPRVLFYTLRGWYAHVMTEAVLAAALRQRGVETSFLLCGGLLDQCDFKPPSDPFVTAPLCWRCTGFSERMLDAAGQPHRRMDDFIDVAAVRRRANARLHELTREELLAYEDGDGLPIGRIVVPSVQRGLLSGSVPADEGSVEILRGYVASAIVVAELCRVVLELERPDVVVMTNGLFFAERIMLHLARRQGSRVVTYERGVLANTIVVDVDKPVVPFDVDPYWERRRSVPLTASQRARVQRLLDARMRGEVGVQDLWPRMEADGRAIVERLGFDTSAPTDVMFTNILWDTAVYERDVAFAGMLDWVESTIQAYRSLPERQLVVRVHPAEVRLEMRRSRERVSDRLEQAFPTLPTNVAVLGPDDPASSYAVMRAADVVLTYTSTIGLEAALLGRPVVVAGDAHYRGRGFTADVEDRATYADLVCGGALCPPDDGSLELAWRYAHCFFEYTREFPWLDDRSRARRDLLVQDAGALAPGSDEALDELCDLLLGRTAIPLRVGE